MKSQKKTAVLLMSVMLLQAPLSLSTQAKAKYDLQRQQYNAQASSINYSGNKLISCDDKLTVSDGLNKAAKTLATFSKGYGSSVMAKGSYIFYTDPDANAIKRCKKDGSGQQVIATYGAEDYVDLIISGSKVIYSANGLYTVSTQGKDNKKISGNVNGKFFTNGDDLFYATKSKLYKYDLKTGKQSTVKTGFKIKGFEIIGMEGSILYLSNHNSVDFYEKGEKTSIYKFDTSSKQSGSHMSL